MNISNEDVGFIDRFMTNFLVFSGIWRSGVDHRHNPTMAYLNLTVLALGFMSISYMFILKYNDIDVNTEILLHFVEVFHSICTQIMFIAKKDQIARLAEDVCITFKQMNFPYDRSTCLAILHQERNSFRKVMRLACSAILTIYFSVAVDTIRLLFNDHRQLPYPSWFPFNTNHVVPYLVATLFQCLIYLEMICVDLAVVGLWYATINKVSGLLSILGLSLQRLGDPTQGRGRGREHSQDLRSCIELHVYIKRLIQDLNSTMGLLFLEVVLTSQIAICFCGYHVTQGVISGERARFLKYTSGVVVFTLMLLVYCASGQKLKDKSEELCMRMYDSEWYERTIHFKKTLYLCQIISKKPLMIEQILPADLHTFMNSMRAVFSYLNFLLAMKDKS